jgi:hypothetical protein
VIRSRQFILILGLIALLLLSVTGAAAQERTGGDRGRNRPEPRITWRPAGVVQAVAPGQTVQINVTLKSNVDLSNVTLHMPRMLGRVMRAEPRSFARLPANTPTRVTFTVHMPADRTEGVGGAVVVTAGDRVIPTPLNVRLPLARPRS